MAYARRRIRAISPGERWIVSGLANRHEALDFEELAAQAAAVSPDKIRGRLERALQERVR